MPRNLKEVSHRFLYPFHLQVKLIGLLLRISKFSSPPRANNVDTFLSGKINQPHPHASQRFRSCVGVECSSQFGKLRELFSHVKSIRASKESDPVVHSPVAILPGPMIASARDKVVRMKGSQIP